MLESQRMQRFRLSSTPIQFTTPSEMAVNSDTELDNQAEQRLTSNPEVIRFGNLLDQVFSFRLLSNKFLIHCDLGTNYCY